MSLGDYSNEDLIRELQERGIKAEIKPEPLQEIDWSGVMSNCIEYVDQLDEEGYPPKDIEHYIMESAMSAVFGDGVWEWINSKT